MERCGCLSICLLFLSLLCNNVFGDLPRFTTLPDNGKTVGLREELALPCSATGSPLPKIVNWLLNDKPVNFNTGNHYLRPTGELYIQSAQKSDSGFYQCVAQNREGGIVSEKRRVYVAYFDRLSPLVITRKSIVEHKSHIILPPKINCEPKPIYRWSKDGTQITEDSPVNNDFRISAEGGLYISNININAQGTYKLNIENTFMSQRNADYASQAALQIIISVTPDSNTESDVKVIYSSPKQVVGEGRTESVTLECFITGVGPEKTGVIWKKIDNAGREIPISTNNIKYNVQNRRLIINKPTYSGQNGVFRCIPNFGLNEFPKNGKDIELVVEAPTTFLTKPSKVNVYTDNTTLLNCTSVGMPNHTTRWYRNGLPLDSGESNGYTIYQNNTILLTNLNWEDHGVFQCGAENAAGLNFLQIQVNVQNISASIVGEFKNQYLYLGTTNTIACVAVGAPRPTMTWMKNNHQIFPNSKYNILLNGTLVINNIENIDSGTYTCTASNYIQTVSKSAEVYIVTPTRISNFPPREYPVIRGSTFKLPCEVEHDLRVNYTREWRFNNLPIQSQYYVVQPDGSLMIHHVQSPRDTDIDFSCHIFADDGNFTNATTLVLKNRPLQPSSPRQIDVQPFFLTIGWDAPSDGGSALTGFVLYMKNASMRNYILLTKLNASQTKYTIRNLRAGDSYRFQVAAENKFGAGTRSAESAWIETKTLAPSGAPKNFRTLTKGTDFVKLAWEAPSEHHQNGLLLGYHIGYRVAVADLEDSFIITELKSTSTEYEMTGLPLFTTYQVKVAAYNKAGRGPWSDVEQVKTLQGIPSTAPTDVVVSVKNSTTVLVSFKSPPQQLWNGELSSIIARYWPPELPQNQEQYVTNYDSSSIYEQSFYLPTLEPDREYVLAVAVGTNGGFSPGSLTVQFRTKQGKPDEVQDLQVSNTYSDAFTVVWKKPIQTGGIITGYVIRYRVFGSLPWRELKEHGKAIGAVVLNLQPKTKYEVKVAATTSAGIGPFLTRSATTTFEPELPKAPSNLKAYAVWGSSIALGWTPGDSGRAVILHYYIEYNNDTDYHEYPSRAKWRLIRNLTKILENPANITGLKPSSVYRFRMTAINRVGPSPISNVSDDITTGEGNPDKAPTNIIISAPIRKGLLIKWTPPSRESWNSGSVKYQFQIKPKGQDPKISVPYVSHPDAQATSYTARGLNMYTMYNVTIRLYNDKGFGPWSKPQFFRTSEDYPSGAPKILSGYVESASKVQLKWEAVPELQRNGIILGYKVFYNIRGVENTELFKDFPGNTTFEGSIDDLNGYTDYEFRMMAYTKVGGKLKGSPLTKKTKEGKPGKPTNVKFTKITYDSLEVEWDPPIRPNGNILRYRVNYTRNITDAEWVPIPLSKYTPRSAKAPNLVYNSYYWFKIEAETRPGWGTPALELVLVTTDRELPESPVILGIPFSSVRQTSVVVEWRPRFDGNSPIRSFNLQYNKDYSGWQTLKYGMPPVENIPAEVNRLEVDKLDYASQYQFRIRAINDIGNSPWSDNSKTVTTHQKDPKGAPGNVRVLEKTPTSLLIAWERPKEFDLSSSIRGYRVSWELSAGIGQVKEKGVSEDTFELRIEKLKVFSAYEVRVGVFNDFGEGIWSQRYKWRTGEDRPLDPPSNVKVVLQGRDTVRVTWVAPDANNVRGWVLGYKIESRRVGTGSKRKRRSTENTSNFYTRRRRSLLAVCKYVPPVTTHLAGPYAQEVTLKNLRKFTRYEITVRVYNSYGDGPKSRAVSFSTPADIPGPPYLLSDRVYTDSIAVDFAAPCDPNGVILGYRFRYKEFGRDFSNYNDRSPKTRRVEIKGLIKETNYVFELSAKTSSGFGQVTTIDFRTKGPPSLPGKPGPPEEYENKPGALVLVWDERDNGNAPVTKFALEYKKAGGNAATFKYVTYNEVRYDGLMAIYMFGSLKANQKYEFRVRSHTKMGSSQWSDWSQPIIPVSVVENDKAVHEEIWFIFLLVIIFLIFLIILVVCCWKYGCKEKMKYKTKKNGYNMSSFEMAMVRQGGSDAGSEKRLLPAGNGSLAPSVASSTKKSIAKSSSSLANSDEREPLTQNNTPLARREMPEDSIANHYSNDPFHKNWRDSLDKKTKKEILAEYSKRRPSDGSIDSLEEKKKEPIYDRARPRPGRKDISELKNLARSQPELAAPGGNPYQQSRPQQVPRRPGKRPVDRDLARSVPDLNRNNGQTDSPVTRQPSFLRATVGDSDDNESLREVFQREKSKREIAMELDNRLDDFYPNTAPPPYDYDGAPPAYSPSDISEGSEFDFGKKTRPYYPPQPPTQPRFSDYSDNSDFAQRDVHRNRPAPHNGGFSRPPGRGYFNPEEEYPRYPARNHYPSENGRQRPELGGYSQVYPNAPSSSTEPPRSPHSSDHQFSPGGRFSPPQNAYIDEDGDEIDGYEPDMTLV